MQPGVVRLLLQRSEAKPAHGCLHSLSTSCVQARDDKSLPLGQSSNQGTPHHGQGCYLVVLLGLGLALLGVSV